MQHFHIVQINHKPLRRLRNLKINKTDITSQKHSYAVDTDSLGVKCDKDKIFSVQYHSESATGPQDSADLFDRFIELMKEEHNNADRS